MKNNKTAVRRLAVVQDLDSERFRDSEITERLLAMGEDVAVVSPGILTEVDGMHVHHVRVGNQVEVRVLSEEALREVREKIGQFWDSIDLYRGTVVPGGEELLSLLEGGASRIEREVSEPGADLGAIEDALRDNGQASAALLLKRLLEKQDKKLPVPVCKECGEDMKLMSGLRKKTYTTKLGPIEIERRYYYCKKSKKGIHPLDEWLQLEGKSLTPGVERMLIQGKAEMSIKRTSELVESWAGVKVSRSRVDRETRRLGEEVEDFEAQQVEKAPEGPSVSVIGIDGTGVPVRKSELEDTKSKDGEGQGKTREAKVLRICEVEQDEESGKVSTVDGSMTQNAKIDSADQAEAKGDYTDFAVRLSREAMRRGTFLADIVVILSDGAPWIENTARIVFASMVLVCILDLFHALEKLGAALKAIYPDPQDYALHFKKMKAMLKAGEVSKVIDELNTHINIHPDVAKCIRYYEANLDRMRYHEYAKLGLPLGSGLIEGACKTVVADRLKKGGSRWTVDGANGTMALRCLEMNHRTTDFFNWRDAA